MIKILIVDDEIAFTEAISKSLYLYERYDILTANTYNQAKQIIENETLDLIMLDIMLSDDKSGMDLCNEIREKYEYNTPIIFLSAKDKNTDKIAGFAIGCDSYITKPVETRVLIGHIKAILRRSKDNQKESQNNPDKRIIKINNIKLDLRQYELTVNNKVVQTPLKEFKLLLLLIEEANSVVHRRIIIQKLWNDPYSDTCNKSLDVHIKRLRDKIEDDPYKPKQLLTVRNVGYKFITLNN